MFCDWAFNDSYREFIFFQDRKSERAERKKKMDNEQKRYEMEHKLKEQELKFKHELEMEQLRMKTNAMNHSVIKTETLLPHCKKKYFRLRINKDLHLSMSTKLDFAVRQKLLFSLDHFFLLF